MVSPERGPTPFVKVEGLGNDFLLFDCRSRGRPAARTMTGALLRAAPVLCDRRRGIGADGILVVTDSDNSPADAAMVVVNHDGSRPEMCGNGLRCVAMHLAHALERDRLCVDTDAGALACVVRRASTAEADVKVQMGAGQNLGAVVLSAANGRTFDRVSMGNPHAIAFANPDEDPRDLARTLGPTIETDPMFPQRTNVEFARIESDGSMTVWVWERGVGITEACGTGACAVAFVAAWSHRAPLDTPIDIHLPGGTLAVTVPTDPTEQICAFGPARRVFEGTVWLPYETSTPVS